MGIPEQDERYGGLRHLGRRAYLTACFVFVTGCGETPDSPSVLIYLVDTLRADHVGAYGHDLPTTPAMDALAADGVVFERALAQSSWTKPAVASIMTGRTPPSHRTIRWNATLPEDEKTLAEVLQSAGYRTAGFVTNELVAARFGFDQGFDSYERVGSMVDLAADRVTQAATEWLQGHNPGVPFFLYLHVTDPHAPHTPTPEDLESLAVEVEDPARGLTGIRSQLGPAAAMPPERLAAVRSDLMALYDGEIRFADTQFGALVRTLKEQGLYDSTLIVVLSDHGEEFYEHGDLGHGDTLFIEQLWVPMLVKFPGQAHAGLKVPGITRQVDVLPTILDVTGVSPPPGVEGASAMCLVRGEQEAGGGRPSFAYLNLNSNPPLESVCWGQFHLIRTLEGAEPPMEALFHLGNDPGEQHAIAGEHAQVRAALSALLDGQKRSQAGDISTTEVDASTLEVLKAMGYVGDEE